MKKMILSLSVAVLLAGCHTQSYVVSSENARSQASYDKMQHFFVAGLGQQQEKNATEVCGEGKVAKVQTQQTFLNGFLNTVSYGIYSPRDMRIYCK